MTDAVAIIGQSLGENLWLTTGVPGLPTPTPGTLMLTRGALSWVAPTNALIIFANKLIAATGVSHILAAAEGGAGLMPQSVIQDGHHAGHYWTNFTDPTTSPLLKFTSQLPSVSLRLIWFIGCNQDEHSTPPPSRDDISAGITAMYDFICAAAGVASGAIPMLTSLVGREMNSYLPEGREVMLGQAMSLHDGNALGADYYVLPRQTDGVHLTPGGCGTFASIGADAVIAALS